MRQGELRLIIVSELRGVTPLRCSGQAGARGTVVTVHQLEKSILGAGTVAESSCACEEMHVEVRFG
jgi:hypothetical protein